MNKKYDTYSSELGYSDGKKRARGFLRHPGRERRCGPDASRMLTTRFKNDLALALALAVDEWQVPQDQRRAFRGTRDETGFMEMDSIGLGWGGLSALRVEPFSSTACLIASEARVRIG